MRDKAKRRLKFFGISIISMLVALTAMFLVYASIYYKADDIALGILKSDQRIDRVSNFIILSPKEASKQALIFYPGAKVEAIAYLPILSKLADNGITCVLVKMPFNMAIFNSSAADKIYELLPHIEHWYIGGHSMGGAMASSYASKNIDRVEGLILLGAYIYGGYPPHRALTVYGTFNDNLEKYIDYSDNIVVIEGGNHAQFGNYGEQKGDPKATISWEMQQKIAVEAIIDFLEGRP